MSNGSTEIRAVAGVGPLKWSSKGSPFFTQMREKPRPNDLVAKQPLGEAVEFGRGWIARTP